MAATLTSWVWVSPSNRATFFRRATSIAVMSYHARGALWYLPPPHKEGAGPHVADNVNKVTIIGSGPAGYTAAIYAARANLAPVIFAGGPAEEDPQRVPGGQLMITTDVENYPGFPESITGPGLMERFQKQAERFGTAIHMENVVRVDFSARPFFIQGDTQSCRSQTVIIATGASAKWLNVKGEDT